MNCRHGLGQDRPPRSRRAAARAAISIRRCHRRRRGAHRRPIISGPTRPHVWSFLKDTSRRSGGHEPTSVPESYRKTILRATAPLAAFRGRSPARAWPCRRIGSAAATAIFSPPRNSVRVTRSKRVQGRRSARGVHAPRDHSSIFVSSTGQTAWKSAARRRGRRRC